MRATFAELVLKESIVNPNILLLTGDLGYGVLDEFMSKLPSQFMNCGVSEQSMIGVAGGLSASGKKVFVYSIANFPTFRCLEQIRNDLVYMNNTVTIVSVGAGFSYGSQGYTHHGIEDLAIMRCLGNIRIYSPADAKELEALMPLVFNYKSTSYLRLGKGGEDIVHKSEIKNVENPILYSYSNKKIESKSICILSTGSISSEINKASESISSLCNFSAYSVPVLDEGNIKKFLSTLSVDLVITLEEHVISGGFGSFVLEIAAKSNLKIPIKNIGINQTKLKESGSQNYLRSYHGLDSEGIVKFIKQNL